MAPRGKAAVYEGVEDAMVLGGEAGEDFFDLGEVGLFWLGTVGVSEVPFLVAS